MFYLDATDIVELGCGALTLCHHGGRREGMTERTLKLASAMLVIASCMIGFVVCEIAYRVVLKRQDDVRWRTPNQFSVYSNSVWDFDPDLGYTYRPQSHYDIAVMRDGIPVRCGTFVTGPLGSPGKGLKPEERADVGYIVLGDSVTATVHDGETWPDILNKRIERPMLNLARDGYGVLQMFDLAAKLLRDGHRPSVFVVAIIGPDLVRARFWRMTIVRNNKQEVFVSTRPSFDIEPVTHARAVFIYSSADRSWCEAARASGHSDATSKDIVHAFGAMRSHDEALFRPAIQILSIAHCYLCDLLRRSPNVRAAQSPAHDLDRFQDDAQFRDDLTEIRKSGVPIWLVYLPYLPELSAARKQMKAREQKLFASLTTEVDRVIDLTPNAPMGDLAIPLTMLPDDPHPSRAGLEYYANELFRRGEW
jgi:hypothetical protein